MGGFLVIYKMYHTQIQPLNGKQFLLSSHTITCIKMVPLKTPVISANDLTFQKIQEINRINYRMYEDDICLLV